MLNKDKPGVIGAVGSLLGERGINVSSMHVGLDQAKGVALALWNVDNPLSEDVLAAVRGIPLIESAQVIEL